MTGEVFDEVAHEYLTARGYDTIVEWATDRGYTGSEHDLDLLRDLLGDEMERGWV